jgi:endonuclease/exonuclease/phosphatase family metal-dependent hydrolase
LRYYGRSRNVHGLKLDYGTAIVSKFPIEKSHEYTFSMTWPTFSKGFHFSTIQIPNTKKQVDMVSVHLDFLNPRAKVKQIKQLHQFLQKRPEQNPLIIMGDFNCDMRKKEVLPFLMEKWDLHTYQPENLDIVTFPTLQKRIDWILVSKSFKIIEYKVLVENISDHYPVLAKIEW